PFGRRYRCPNQLQINQTQSPGKSPFPSHMLVSGTSPSPYQPSVAHLLPNEPFQIKHGQSLLPGSQNTPLQLSCSQKYPKSLGKSRSKSSIAGAFENSTNKKFEYLNQHMVWDKRKYLLEDAQNQQQVDRIKICLQTKGQGQLDDSCARMDERGEKHRGNHPPPLHDIWYLIISIFSSFLACGFAVFPYYLGWLHGFFFFFFLILGWFFLFSFNFSHLKLYSSTKNGLQWPLYTSI
ncbi:hypothetical protein VP01_5268g1, partial [Puccinia sorghi]